MVYGGNISTTISSGRIISEYLRSNGNNGTRPEAMVFIGGDSVMFQGNLDCGIGAGRGAGGDLNEGGVGGCLYILSSKIYCLCTVQVPAEHQDANVTITVTGDDFTEGINTKANVGTITGKGTQTFIVKKGATIEYTVEKEHYIAQGKVENIGTVAATEGTYNSSNNTHTIPVTLKKKILTHTIQTNGANITINGRFTDADGNVINTSMNGTGSITFNVLSEDNNVSYTATKTYYDTRNGSISVTSNGETTNVELPKTKYYIQNVSSNMSNSGRLTLLDGNYASKYLAGGSSRATISGNRSSLPPNWIICIDKCYRGNTIWDGFIEVKINGSTEIYETNIPTNESNWYTTDGSGAVNNIEINIKAPVSYVYIDAIYFVVDD